MSHRSLGGRIRVYAAGIAILGAALTLAVVVRGVKLAPQADMAVWSVDEDVPVAPTSLRGWRADSGESARGRAQSSRSM
ncbi:hypothetical protein BH23GEM9_BH23GEM9_21000 [soil metagenome]